MTQKDYFVYETKCRRCGKFHVWVYGEAEESKAFLFVVRMAEMLKYPPQNPCKKCKKDTIQELVSYGREKI